MEQSQKSFSELANSLIASTAEQGSINDMILDDSVKDEIVDTGNTVNPTISDETKTVATPTEDLNTYNVSGLITGFDVVMSRLMALGCRIGKINCSVADFQLTSKEKKDLEPVAGRLAKKYAYLLTDEALLGIMVGSMYVGRIAILSVDTGSKPKRVKSNSSATLKSEFVTEETDTDNHKRGRGRPRKI